MGARQPTSRLISEVQQVLSRFSPNLVSTDRDHLRALAKAVLGSVDSHDLRSTNATQFLEQLEQILDAIEVRKRRQILTRMRHPSSTDTIVFETCMEDQPFLVSTVRSFFEAHGLDVKRFLAAIVPMRRDPAGNIIAIGRGTPESVMRIEVVEPESGPDGISQKLNQRLELAQAMVFDFERMIERVQAVADGHFAAAAGPLADEAQSLRESEELLRWLCEENFVLMSVERYGESLEPLDMLGIGRVARPARNHQRLEAAARATGRLVYYERSAEESPVHRAGKPGYFVVPEFGPDGAPTGACVIDGLFTYKALHTPREEVPFIRLALHEMLADRDIRIDSDRGKNITNAFNSLPLEYLLTEERESIWDLTDRVLRAEVEGGSDVHIRISEGSRFAFALVALPRSQFSEELRQEVQRLLLEALGATYADFGVYIDRYDNAVIHFYLTGAGPFEAVDTEGVRQQVLALSRGWNERLRTAIAMLVSEDVDDELFNIYENAFSEQHKRRSSVDRLVGDIRCLENLRGGLDIDCDLFVARFDDHPGLLNLRIFSREALNLSREMPVISHFGFEVIDEYSRDVGLPGRPVIDMDNFRLAVRPDRIGPILSRRTDLVEAIRAVFEGRIGDDDLNRLVVVSSLSARDVEILRAYLAYMRQLGLPFPLDLIRRTLVEHPWVTEAVMAHLAAQFDPGIAHRELATMTGDALEQALRAVSDYTVDRVLQAVAAVVLATKRTNAYVAKPGGAYAFKIAAQELKFGREPRPYREIWVYHPTFEGIHLRGGKVARGGLRFSDRPDDFHTEIHDLMATQMVKNVLIVPMGAKGGFVLRDAPTDRVELRAAGDRAYERFISALLSITDNVVGGEVVTPDGILHTEAPDPYLVVAADKGTAHLSDTANAISMRRHFWLDDAFASGGSHGYDHKATGITARGAWEVAKRNFHELGIDPEHDTITAVGVGDMSGDVFGNGLLRSRTIKLLAAFNHMHIFVDPTPDPERSYRERERLFGLGSSQWTDYDERALSLGGGVYSRKAKEVPLSVQARELLGFRPDQELNGDEVISAILTLGVDLLWMGGIGTYVKSGAESHVDVGDKANDSVRADARDLRCRILAEGANLAITDRGRVEFAQAGGHNYNACLDNSGGVDLSDHEVNIKILLAPLVAAGTLPRDDRNRLLVECQATAIDNVLDNNRSQSRMASYDVRRSRVDLHRYGRALGQLALRVPFDAHAFALPNEEELANRARKNAGLHKCEATVLCAHAKMLAYRELLDAEPLEPRLSESMLRSYFPPAALAAAKDGVNDHLLRRDIATTVVVNRIVDNAGATVFTEVGAATGRDTRSIAHAYMNAAWAAGVESIEHELYALEDSHRQEVVYGAMRDIQDALEDAVCYLLDGAWEQLERSDVEGCRRLLQEVSAVQPRGAEASAARRIAELEGAGLPHDLSERIVRLRHLTSVLDATRLAADLGRSAHEMLEVRLEVADRMNFVRLQRALLKTPRVTAWDGPAANALTRHLNFHLHKMSMLVDGDVEAMIRRFHLGPLREQVAEQLEKNVSISAVVTIDDQLRRLLPSKVEAGKKN